MNFIGFMFFLTLPYFAVKSCIQVFKSASENAERRRRVEEIDRDIEDLKKSFHKSVSF
jgi:outer membrane lipoprotein-sorting protein